MADLTSEAKRAACLSRLELTTAGVMERMVGEIKTTRPASYDRPVHGIGQDYIKDISLSVSEMEKQCNKIRSTAAENDRIRELDGCLFHMNIVSGYYDGWGHSAEAVVETISSGLQEIQSGMKPALML